MGRRGGYFVVVDFWVLRSVGCGVAIAISGVSWLWILGLA